MLPGMFKPATGAGGSITLEPPPDIPMSSRRSSAGIGLLCSLMAGKRPPVADAGRSDSFFYSVVPYSDSVVRRTFYNNGLSVRAGFGPSTLFLCSEIGTD